MKTKQKVQRTRHPRPMGTTEQITQYHNSQQENKEKILKGIQIRLIQLYVASDMRFNDEAWNINTLSKYLNVNPTITMKVIQEQITRISGFMGGQDNEAYARVIKFRAQKLSLDIQGIGTQQVEVLARAQGRKYVPFLTGALNQAIGNLTQIHKTQLELIRAMHESARPASGINNDKQFGNTGTAYLTPDEALKLINAENTNFNEIEYTDMLAKGLGPIPDVCARNQDLTSIGIGLNKQVIVIPTPTQIPGLELTPKTAQELARMADHTDRDRP